MYRQCIDFLLCLTLMAVSVFGMPSKFALALPKWPLFFQLGFLLWVAYWLLILPSPGKGVLLLAVVAGIMSLQPDMKWYHRVVWIFILSWSAFIEISSLDKDREAHESEFRTITAGLKDAIQQSEVTIKQTNTLLAETKKVEALTAKNLEQITGGADFCYLAPLQLYGERKARLLLGNSGSIVLPMCEFRGAEVALLSDTPEEAMRKFNILNFREEKIPPRQWGAHFISQQLDVGPNAKYQFVISTPTRQFFETINFSLNLATGAYTPSCELRAGTPVGKILKRGCDTMQRQ